MLAAAARVLSAGLDYDNDDEQEHGVEIQQRT
jgi:hypothetical protein